MKPRSHAKPFCWRVESAKGDEFPSVILSGFLDETIQLDELEAVISGRVRFVLREVGRINSVGSHHWFQFLQRIARFGQHRFLECSPSIVRLLNMVPIFQKLAVVESVMAAFVCPGCNADGMAEIITTNAEIEMPEISCERCGSIMEFDESPTSYFRFMGKRK